MAHEHLPCKFHPKRIHQAHSKRGLSTFARVVGASAYATRLLT
jgi:hypothetical protein